MFKHAYTCMKHTQTDKVCACVCKCIYTEFGLKATIAHVLRHTYIHTHIIHTKEYMHTCLPHTTPAALIHKFAHKHTQAHTHMLEPGGQSGRTCSSSGSQYSNRPSYSFCAKASTPYLGGDRYLILYVTMCVYILRTHTNAHILPHMLHQTHACMCIPI